PKHFALNSVENSRWVIDVQVDERTLREVYLPHFKRTIQEGKPASLMSAYNSVRGSFCGANKELLTDILRDEWGFKGFVTTDWLFGLYDGVGGVNAGLNVEMPFRQYYTAEALGKAIEAGEISETSVDDLIVQSLATRLRYAMVDDQDQYPASIIAQPSSIDLAREAAESSMVLIKNEDVLPFSKSSRKKIAVIGRLADLPNTGDQGSSDATPTYVITPYQGIRNYHEKLGNEVVLHNGADLESARTLAATADEVILVVGFTYKEEGEYIIMSREPMLESAKAGRLIGEKGEGGDREELNLLASDEALIQAMAKENDQLAVVYVGGSAIDMGPWEDEVPAILFAWYAGMEGGTALTNVLYGEVNPSGKLPFTIAADEDDYPTFTPYAEQITYDYYHGYTLMDKKSIAPAYPFGYGLSYADFSYSNLQVVDHQLSKDSTLLVSVDVTNTSDLAGREVVQMYIGFSQSAVERPVKLLRDFEKVRIAPGETKTVQLEVEVKDLAWYNPTQEKWTVESMEYEVYVGSSSDEKDLLTSKFEVKEF
ncbi:MAG: glycoside hydrolase family 3 C-terminal domain-containing protein, partial [Bacteroidota bacterium]